MMEEPPPPNRRTAGRRPALSDAERRRRILKAAETVFLGRGYAAASMDDIARGCGMSKKTVYRAFATKEALFSDLIETVLDAVPDYDPEEDGEVGGEEALRKALQSLAEIILHPRQLALARLVVAEAPHAPELAAGMHEKGIVRGEAILARIVARLRERKLIEPRVGDELAGFLLGAVIGDWAIVGMIGRGAPPSSRDIAARIERLFDMIRPAIFAGVPSTARCGQPSPPGGNDRAGA